MKPYDAMEISYNNGYKQGVKDLAERIKKCYSKSIKGEKVGVSVYYYVDVIAEEMLGERSEK